MSTRQYLCDHHFNVTRQSPDGRKESLLSVAARHGDQQAFLWLLEHGADVNAVDERKNSLLHQAGAAGNQRVAMVLLSLLWRKTVLF